MAMLNIDVYTGSGELELILWEVRQDGSRKQLDHGEEPVCDDLGYALGRALERVLGDEFR